MPAPAKNKNPKKKAPGNPTVSQGPTNMNRQQGATPIPGLQPPMSPYGMPPSPPPRIPGFQSPPVGTRYPGAGRYMP